MSDTRYVVLATKRSLLEVRVTALVVTATRQVAEAIRDAAASLPYAPGVPPLTFSVDTVLDVDVMLQQDGETARFGAQLSEMVRGLALDGLG